MRSIEQLPMTTRTHSSEAERRHDTPEVGLSKRPVFTRSFTARSRLMTAPLGRAEGLVRDGAARPSVREDRANESGTREPVAAASSPCRQRMLAASRAQRQRNVHPGSEDLQRHAAGRDGDLTGLISPKISGQYGALRLGPGRSPRTVL